MRKIVAGLFMSLDGVVESPGTWAFQRYLDAEQGQMTLQYRLRLVRERLFRKIGDQFPGAVGKKRRDGGTVARPGP